tara:strand:- start:250 stop:426 length:177 start_codon:yes stop_codon:yes gene_type:complete
MGQEIQASSLSIEYFPIGQEIQPPLSSLSIEYVPGGQPANKKYTQKNVSSNKQIFFFQ